MENKEPACVLAKVAGMSVGEYSVETETKK